MNSTQRDEVANILEIVAKDGLPEPRDLDVALDAIAECFKHDIIHPKDVPLKGPWSFHSKKDKKFRAQNGKCCYCECDMIYPPSLPENKRGSHPLIATTEHLHRQCECKEAGVHVNRAHNTALACNTCNSKRQDMPWIYWKSICMKEISIEDVISECQALKIKIPLFELANRNENENI